MLHHLCVCMRLAWCKETLRTFHWVHEPIVCDACTGSSDTWGRNEMGEGGKEKEGKNDGRGGGVEGRDGEGQR